MWRLGRAQVLQYWPSGTDFQICLGTRLLQSFVVGRPSCFQPLSHEERKTTIRYQMS